MQGGLTVHGVDEGHVVDAGGEAGKEVAHPAPAGSMLAKLPETALAIARLGGKELELAVGVEGGAVAFGKLGLVVPSVHLADSPGAKDLYDRFGFGRMVHRELIPHDFLGP